MSESTELGEFLRARRELVQPSDVGLRVGGIRRVTGLRREEVAMLAGISADYYLRLEQGRDRNPSVQVLTALAGVFQLDDEATEHLVRLGQPASARTAKPRIRREVAPESIRQLLGVLGLPAFVESRALDVLATNDLATALNPSLAVGRNRLRDVFLDRDERALYPDWSRLLPGIVANFRAAIGTDTDDPRVVQLVGELSLASDEFRRLWARHDVRAGQGGITQYRHPQVGDLTLRREKLAIRGADGQLLVILHAADDADSAGLLRLLGTLSVGVGAAPEVGAAVADADRPGRVGG
ncbi:helix-turn-helix transcriptional regulator [Frondihabitans sp. 4ASC-45]|uniref:helix-turn-helix domain-containing protein n=1 Tax=Frondihabitans sp. 4ASC-45 TaxID=3111636 RepID=UPI003C274683